MKKFLLTSFSVCFAIVFAVAQDRVISGRVTSSEDGSPLPGVNVVVKGTTNGAVTDSDGKYSLSAPAGASLIFSFIGLKAQEIPVGEQSVIDVSLALDATQLSEIVVTGVGTAVEKRKLAISVESVSGEKLPKAPTASVDQALVGKIAGAQISSVSGDPGAQVQILLRGINTIQRGTTPMILVDGVQVVATSLNALDLSAVENIEVVQGAAAATIYGAQGANGVIQIFTKKGKAGKVQVDFSTSVAQNEFLNVGGLEKAHLHAFATDGSGNVVTAGNVPITLSPTDLTWSGSIVYDALNPLSNANKPYGQNFKYYDHFKQFFGSSHTYNHSARISGGSDLGDFALTVSNNKQESAVKNGGYNERTNLTANIGINLLKGLTLRSTTQLAFTKNTVNHYIYGVFNSRPFVNFEEKDIDGNYGANYGGAGGVNGFNPNYYNQYTDDVTRTVDVVQSFDLTYKLPKFLELSAKYGLNYRNNERIYDVQNQSTNQNIMSTAAYWTGFYVDTDQGEIDNFKTTRTFKNLLTKATLNFDFQKDFNMSIPLKSTTLIGYDYRNDEIKTLYTWAAGMPLYKPYTMSNGNTFRTQELKTTPFITYGYMVNQRFEYGDIFGVSGGFRTDYSSAFGRGSKPFTFPRGDAFFRLSGFSFWDNSGISDKILDLKFRVAYGKAGIQPQAFDRYVTVPASVIGGSTSFTIPVSSRNPDLRVEVSQEMEYGMDVTFNFLDNTAWLNNITFSGTYWDRSSKDVIYEVDVAPSSGVGKQLTNAFGMASRGLQFSLSTKAYHNSDFNWNLTTNFGKSTSEITDVLGGGEIVVLSSAGSTNYVLKAGRKVGQLYGYKVLHSVDQIDPLSGQPYIPTGSQANYSVASNGYVVENATKQPFYTPNLISFGDPNPKFNMAFINDFSFKNWLSFGFQIDWIQGNHLYNQTKEWMYRDGIHSDYNKPITINGETGNWTAFYRGNYAQRAFNGTKDYFYEDASFVRLRNVNVAVDFVKLFNIPKLRTLQVVLTGRNLWTKTNYSGMDPEISSGTLNSAWDRGTDHNSMPNLKTYQVGLNFGF